MNFSSKILEEAVTAMNTLPSIGKKTALRLVLHLAANDSQKIQRIVKALTLLDEKLQMCEKCHNYSDDRLCQICSDVSRNKRLVCVVSSPKDVMAIESTQQYSGVYHVLGGVISPLEGIGPEDLRIDTLVAKVSEDEVEEIIMAISPTIEGDTTIFYISKLLEGKDAKISTIARGVSFGGELEYADQLTLGRSIHSRIDYSNEVTL